MTQRLQSFYSNNRKEAAYKLGQLGDPRAVPSLVHVLKYDYHKDVRIASAIALGEIGGAGSAIALERASIYDHKDEVRHASATALERLNAKAKASPPDFVAGRAAACCAETSRSGSAVSVPAEVRRPGSSPPNRRRPNPSHRRCKLSRQRTSRPRRPRPLREARAGIPASRMPLPSLQRGRIAFSDARAGSACSQPILDSPGRSRYPRSR